MKKSYRIGATVSGGGGGGLRVEDGVGEIYRQDEIDRNKKEAAHYYRYTSRYFRVRASADKNFYGKISFY